MGVVFYFLHISGGFVAHVADKCSARHSQMYLAVCHVHGNIMCIKTWRSQGKIRRHPAVSLRRYHSSIAEFKCLNKQE